MGVFSGQALNKCNKLNAASSLMQLQDSAHQKEFFLNFKKKKSTQIMINILATFLTQ
jgi:hypothetical protein